LKPNTPPERASSERPCAGKEGTRAAAEMCFGEPNLFNFSRGRVSMRDVMRTELSRDELKRGGRRLLTAFACVLLAIFLGAGEARAEEGDLTSGAGVFVEPRRAKESAPRPQRTAPRRARTKPVSSNNTPANSRANNPPSNK